MVHREEFDSCCVSEMPNILKYNVETQCEYLQIRKLGILENYPHTQAGIRLKLITNRSRLRDIVRVMSELSESGCKKYADCRTSNTTAKATPSLKYFLKAEGLLK